MERKKYVDYIKAIGIILVVVGHVNFANSLMKAWIYSFHMPLFFFATGLIIRSERIDKHYILKKTKSLLIPYVIWGVLYSGYSLSNLLKIGYGSYYALSAADSLTSLWFLNTMFLSLLMVQIILKIKNDYIKLLFTMIMLFVALSLKKIEKGYPWCFDIACISSSFVLLGYFWEKYHKRFKYASNYVIVLIGFALTMIYRSNLQNCNGYVLMANGRIGDPVLFIGTALGGCLGVYGVTKILTNIVQAGKIQKTLIYLGKNTLAIFLIHKPVIEVFEKMFSLYRMHWGIELVITTSGTLVVSCVIGRLIERMTPCLVGKA